MKLSRPLSPHTCHLVREFHCLKHLKMLLGNRKRETQVIITEDTSNYANIKCHKYIV